MTPIQTRSWLCCFLAIITTQFNVCESKRTEQFTHGPQRPLPVARKTQLADGPKRFVDAARGDDRQSGAVDTPWKTVAHAVRQLQPGDTLYLRGGTYFEHFALTRSGTEDAPITVSSYPGELAVIDGGLREFQERPQLCWMPVEGGADGEFVSMEPYPTADSRRAPTHFLPGNWEPMLGKEDERPLALGNFADSMVPLHGYRLLADLRAANEFQLRGKFEGGMYAGPGLWFNRETGRIHIRLAHHRLPGLEDRAYDGQTDPRKVPLVIAAGFGEEVLRITGLQHVILQDLVFRGATGNAMIHIYGSENIRLDHVTVFGGAPALLINASENIQVAHSAFRGLAAPWISRAHQKYRGTPAYQIVLRNDQPLNENIEFAWCEFTDDHDFAFLRFAKNLQFHHNYVDNFNDDGLECGPKLRDHTIFIYQNRIGRCYIPLTQHQFTKDDSPAEHDPGSGVFVYRNVFDMRGGTYTGPPAKTEPNPAGDFLRQEGHLAGDHGSPVWPVMRFYHNTFLRHTEVFRGSHLFGLSSAGLRNEGRDVFNNIFVQTDRVPGIGFIAMQAAPPLREGGNLLWGVKTDPSKGVDPFAAFRTSPLFALSRQQYEPGWTTQDLVADPQFVSLPEDETFAADLRLRPESPAIDAGQPIPAEWPDPLRAADAGAPDLGVLPLGAESFGVGIDGRIPLGGKSPAGYK